MTADPITVVVADDQPVVRAGLTTILQAADGIRIVGHAADGIEAVEQAARLAPQVVLMDIRMPRLDGIEATRRITTSTPARRVLAMTTFALDEYVFGALLAGASGFLLKDAPAPALVDAVRLVAAGEGLIDPVVTRRVIEAFRTGSHPASGIDPLGGLTEREVEVYELLARGRSNAEIAAELGVGEATVKTHVAALLAKLHLRDRIHVVIHAYEHGVVRPGR